LAGFLIINFLQGTGTNVTPFHKLWGLEWHPPSLTLLPSVPLCYAFGELYVRTSSEMGF